MGNTTIQSEQIADDAVTGAKIENAVTIATSVTSPLVDGQNFKVNGAQGSDGQVLTSTGSGVAWEDAAGGVDGISSAATSNAIHIDSASRVSFGTTSPFSATVAQVSQSDNTTFSGIGFSTQVGDGGLVVQNSSTTTNSMAGISFVNGTNTTTSSGTAGYGFWNNYSVQTSTSYKSDLVWSSMSPGGTVYEAMRLTGFSVFNNPRLGIGTNSPSATLDVDGDVNVDGDVDAENYKINGSQGSDGQVLTSTGSGVAWETPAGPTGYSSNGGDVIISADANNNSSDSAIRFELDGTEFARFSKEWDDGLIFGSTSIPTNGSIGGSELTLLRDGAYGVASISNGAPNAVFGKPSSKGSVIEIKTNTSSCGEIGITYDSSLLNRGMYLQGGVLTETVLRLEGSVQAITPGGGWNRERSSNSTDLGLSDARWKDFYLGNDISHRDSGGTARTLYDRSTDTLGNSSTNVTAATVDGTNFKVNGGQGSSGQVLTSSGSGVSWATPAAGGVTSFNVGGNQSGRYYSGLIDNTSASNFTLSTTPYYLPFIVYEDCTIDELSVILNGGTGNSGDVAQIAVYGPVPANLGSTPHIVTSSTFAVDSGYGKTVAITATSFSAGIYLYSFVANTSSLVVRAQANNGKHINYMVGTGNASFPGGLYAAEWSGNTANTWPHSFPSSVSPSQMNHFSGNVPQFKYGVQ